MKFKTGDTMGEDSSWAVISLFLARGANRSIWINYTRICWARLFMLLGMRQTIIPEALQTVEIELTVLKQIWNHSWNLGRADRQLQISFATKAQKQVLLGIFWRRQKVGYVCVNLSFSELLCASSRQRNRWRDGARLLPNFLSCAVFLGGLRFEISESCF